MFDTKITVLTTGGESRQLQSCNYASISIKSHNSVVDTQRFHCLAFRVCPVRFLIVFFASPGGQAVRGSRPFKNGEE